jgi:hypothetical protein
MNKIVIYYHSLMQKQKALAIEQERLSKVTTITRIRKFDCCQRGYHAKVKETLSN